jgi:hypothetical protein
MRSSPAPPDPPRVPACLAFGRATLPIPQHARTLPLSRAGALKEFRGAIIAITHNKSFAEQIQASHVLRVSGGSATLSVNSGLKDSDFDHHAPPAAAAGSGSSNGGGSSGGGGGGKGGAKYKGGATAGKKAGVKGKGAAAVAPAPAAAAAVAPKEAPRKRTTLSWAERTEYEKLCAALDKARAEQAVLEARAAAADPSKRGELEAATAALAAAAERVEDMELRWLDLAERAGDL